METIEHSLRRALATVDPDRLAEFKSEAIAQIRRSRFHVVAAAICGFGKVTFIPVSEIPPRRRLRRHITR